MFMMSMVAFYLLFLLIPEAFPDDSPSSTTITPLTSFLPDWLPPTNTSASSSVSSYALTSTSSYCFSNQTSRGQWVERPGVKAFRCCSPDYNDFRDPALIGHCTATDENHTDLRWWNDTLFAPDRACLCDRIQLTRDTLSEREKYEWKPDGCELRPWNATLFCELLGNRTLLIVGDSTAYQSAGTLSMMISEYVPRGYCGANIKYGPSDHLVRMPANLTSHGERGAGLLKYTHKYRPDIVVMTGGGYHKTFEAYEKMFELLSIDVHKIRSRYKNPPHFVFKTLNPAHARCKPTGLKPFTGMSQFDSLFYPENPHPSWNWHLFRNFDELAKNKSVELGFSIIDMAPLYMRPDAHPGSLASDLMKITNGLGDCFHYCLPGPLNIFSNFLLNMLVEHEFDKVI